MSKLKWSTRVAALEAENAKLRKLIDESGVSELARVPWTPFRPATIPGFPETESYLNSRYQVNVSRQRAGTDEELVELSIKTLDRAAHHDWRDFQRIKNEIVGPEAEGVELYPAESRLVDTANQYWLYCFPRMKLQFGMTGRIVSEASLKVDGFNPSRQRPFESKPADLGARDDERKQMIGDVLANGRRR